MGFFLTDPASLFIGVYPSDSHSRSENYNILFRYLLIIVAIMVLCKWKYTLLFFLITLFIIIACYYSVENLTENFTFENKNINDIKMNCGANPEESNLSLFERIKNFENTCQGYPLFNKSLYIPPRLYDTDVASGYDPRVVLARVNYRPTREVYPEARDFPDVPDPRHKRQPVQYLNDDVSANTVQSHGYLSRNDLRDMFSTSDRVVVNKNIEPANMPDCDGLLEHLESFTPSQPSRMSPQQTKPSSTCTVCDVSHNDKFCPLCGMSSSTFSSDDTTSLQRLKTLPEWQNKQQQSAKKQQGTEHFQAHLKDDMGDYYLDGQTYLFDDASKNVSNMKNNTTPFKDGGLGVDPKDAGTVINRTNPVMYFRKGRLEEEQFPPTHEIDEFAGTNNYVFNRLDPQFVRDSDTLDPARAQEMPKRNQFSQKMSKFEAPSHTTPINDIDGNPAIDMYKIGYNSMKDCAGNIKYMVPESTYQYPNFSKSNVDHILYLNPMYQVMPEQRRVQTLQEARLSAESQFMNDTLNTRAELMEGYLDKLSARRAQQKIAPLSGARGMRL